MSKAAGLKSHQHECLQLSLTMKIKLASQSAWGESTLEMNQVEGWGCYPTVKIPVPELFLSERTAGTKMEKSLRSSDRTKLGFSSVGGPKS